MESSSFPLRFVLFSGALGLLLMTIKPSSLFDETGLQRPFVLTMKADSPGTCMPYWLAVPLLGGFAAVLF